MLPYSNSYEKIFFKSHNEPDYDHNIITAIVLLMNRITSENNNETIVNTVHKIFKV